MRWRLKEIYFILGGGGGGYYATLSGNELLMF